MYFYINNKRYNVPSHSTVSVKGLCLYVFAATGSPILSILLPNIQIAGFLGALVQESVHEDCDCYLDYRRLVTDNYCSYESASGIQE